MKTGRVICHIKPTRCIAILALIMFCAGCAWAPKVTTTRLTNETYRSPGGKVPVYWVGNQPWSKDYAQYFDYGLKGPAAHWKPDWPNSPFQVIGVVSVTHSLPRGRGFTARTLQDGAQRIGADALLGCYVSAKGRSSPGDPAWSCTSLAIKFSSPALADQPVSGKPFVTVEKMIQVQTHSKQDLEPAMWMMDECQKSLNAHLARDGYYVLPDKNWHNADKLLAVTAESPPFRYSIEIVPAQIVTGRAYHDIEVSFPNVIHHTTQTARIRVLTDGTQGNAIAVCKPTRPDERPTFVDAAYLHGSQEVFYPDLRWLPTTPGMIGEAKNGRN